MFKLGNIYATPGVLKVTTNEDRLEALKRHMACNWGEVCIEDWITNNESVELGYRILSIYSAKNGTKFWIVTEADRSATTFLLPSEY